MYVLLEVKLLFVFPAKLDRKNDELDVQGSITDVFIGWVGSGRRRATNRIKINCVRNFKVQMQ